MNEQCNTSAAAPRRLRLHARLRKRVRAWPRAVQVKAQGPAGRAEGLFYLKRIDAIFDDEDHFKHIEAISGLTHPRLEEVTDVSKLHIRSVKDLKRIVSTKLGLSFCDLCLDHRQVFTSEQMLYSRDDLKLHNAKGDADGPLKESNFKGHPRCQCASRHCCTCWAVLSLYRVR